MFNNYNSFMSLKCCSCCGEFTLSRGVEGEFCPICGWVKDLSQETNPELITGRNKKSLRQARDIYFAHRRDHSVF